MTELTATKTQDLLRAKKGEILAIAERHGAYNVRVFDSIAIEALLEHKVDVVTPAMLKPRIRDRVLREATPL